MIKNFTLSSAQQIALSFALVIMTGSLLLNLPFAQIATSDATYLDHLFIAVSAVCVTGLFTESIFDTYNLFGQTVMMVLIQIGGLGLMTIIGLLYYRIGHRLTLKEQIAMTDALNKADLADLGSFIGRIIKYTFIIEGIGALIFTTYLIPQFGWARGIYNSIFLAISAFNNAGFDTWGNNSLIDEQTIPLLNWTIMALIILGGIGYSVWFDLALQVRETRDFGLARHGRLALRRLRPHTKLVLAMTGGIIFTGTLLFLIVEWHNPGTIGHMTIGQKIMTAMFQTVTMRTAGFATVDYTLAKPVSLLVFIATMFIGGGAGGTAGGLKVTTFALVIMMGISEIKQSKFVNFNHHTISRDIVRKAYVIFLIYITFLLVGSGAILALEPDVPYLHILFESISALATVGVTANLTPSLGTESHIILMILMFAGRIGPMTIFLSLTSKERKDLDIQYASTNILIG